MKNIFGAQKTQFFFHYSFSFSFQYLYFLANIFRICPQFSLQEGPLIFPSDVLCNIIIQKLKTTLLLIPLFQYYISSLSLFPSPPTPAPSTQFVKNTTSFVSASISAVGYDGGIGGSGGHTGNTLAPQPQFARPFNGVNVAQLARISETPTTTTTSQLGCIAETPTPGPTPTTHLGSISEGELLKDNRRQYSKQSIQSIHSYSRSSDSGESRCLSVCLSVFLSVCLSLFLSFCLSDFLSFGLYCSVLVSLSIVLSLFGQRPQGTISCRRPGPPGQRPYARAPRPDTPGQEPQARAPRIGPPG